MFNDKLTIGQYGDYKMVTYVTKQDDYRKSGVIYNSYEAKGRSNKVQNPLLLS
ncbi:MAG: hypothetical protein QG610_2124 [Euryarchaeota archaeon]|nr:hypothetical protein [Euryarchaeota archaeon]